MTMEQAYAARRQIALGWAHVAQEFLDEVLAALNKGYCDCRACDDLIDAARQLCTACEWLPFDEVKKK
jgi:hypothetical protein